MVLCMLGRHSTTEPHSQPFSLLVDVGGWMGVFVSQAGVGLIVFPSPPD